MQLPKLAAQHCAPGVLPLVRCSLMPADGTVENSIVKQSANGGKVDVDNGELTCKVPVMVHPCALCLAQVDAMSIAPLLAAALAEVPLLLSCRPC